MVNFLKIAFLGVIGFGFLVYLTAPEAPIKTNKKQKDADNSIQYSTLPWQYEVVGTNKYTKKDDLFKHGDSYLIVLNHEGLSIANKLNSLASKNIVLVANIYNTPWLIKKLAVNSKLADFTKGSEIPLINDEDGRVINALKLKDNTQNKYFIYKINNKKIVKKINEGKIKEGALEFGLKQDELDKIISDISSKLQ